ncbi:DUF4349 domain-containing protein [Microbacterium sp. 5K110]|jgi:hypothetical protein|uniref:DUF4349 domain-containing protein n=1 Tax=unclassified Microbacterium TaxID=2609290 RepID=UPI0010FF2F13|nr:DUF4349 domain-containing protein [Microbacterium sp. 5K110]TLF31630.1 DUF4349 domain-containing protein [Microbacterium sp. 5K110]
MTTPTLPPLRDDRVDAIETAVFARIADERTARRRRRRAVWTGVGAAAAVVVVAAVVGPALTSPTSTGGSSVVGVSEAGGAAVPGLSTGESAEGLRDMSGAAISGDASAASGVDGSASRDIVATGSSTVAVDDVTAAIAKISDAATSAGGYVESSQLGGGIGVVPLDGGMSQPTASSAWITVRVPADALASVMDGLSAVGDVTATSVNRSDVTEQTVDLRARVAAGEASVARLTELMAQAGSVSDLIAAESALAERQAQLDSDRQVLNSIESQVAMSSLSVQLTERSQTVAADPAGFGDGLVAGWNGLVATLNGTVIGLGFLLPWIAVGAVAFVIVWGVRRLIRRRRASNEG